MRNSSGLSLLKLLNLSWLLMIRELRAGQLNIIVIALILAVTSATVISVFSQRLDTGMLHKSTELLGADLRLKSSQKVADEFYQQAKTLGLRTATTLEFPTVVIAGDEMALTALKAVSEPYPLKGQLTTRGAGYAQNDIQPLNQNATQGPNEGEVWLEPRLMALLNVNVGDSVEVGRMPFRIAAIVVQESDRGGNFYSLSPRLLMNLKDVERAGLLQVGSRVTWRLLVAANNEGSGQGDVLEKYQQIISEQLSANQSLESLTDNNQALAASLEKARSYLSLAAILAVLLSGIAIAMAAKDFAQHHFDTSALLRTLGAQQYQVLMLFLFQLTLLAIITSAIGLVVGTVFQQVLVDTLSGVLAKDLPNASWQAWAMASITAPLTLVGFALPHLLSLGAVSPLRVLRRDLEPMGWGSWAVYGLAMFAIFIMSLWFTQDPVMSGIVVIGGFVILFILLMVLQSLLLVAEKLVPISKLSLALRFAWQRIIRDTRATSSQVLAFSLILMVMIVISIVRNDLLADWQKSLPDDAPNFFAMNIQEYEAEAYQQSLKDSGIDVAPLFPMVPGRLIEIDNQLVRENPVLNKDPALQRDLALTWNQALPVGNIIEQGVWLDQQPELKKQVSIEQRLAARLGISLQDELTFDVAGEIFTVTVTSIRSVDWGTLSPNFYLIFSEDVLQNLPLSYLTSFHISADNQSELVDLIRAYPTITLLDMSAVFLQIQGLLEQVTLAVEYLLILVLFAGLLVLLAALHSSLDERMQQGAVLRTLGGSKSQLRRTQWSEFALLGLFAGIVALAGAEALCLVLYQQLFDLEYHYQWQLWLWVPILSAALIVCLAGLSTRKVIAQPPIVVLREI